MNNFNQNICFCKVEYETKVNSKLNEEQKQFENRKTNLFDVGYVHFFFNFAKWNNKRRDCFMKMS